MCKQCVPGLSSGGEEPGNEATTYSANVTAFATPNDTCKQRGLILPNVDLTYITLAIV